MLLTVIESPDVTGALEVASKRYTRTWDAWHALTWVLVRTPGIGLMMSGTPPPWYLYKQDPNASDAPGFVVTYSYDSCALTIHGVKVC